MFTMRHKPYSHTHNIIKLYQDLACKSLDLKLLAPVVDKQISHNTINWHTENVSFMHKMCNNNKK